MKSFYQHIIYCNLISYHISGLETNGRHCFGCSHMVYSPIRTCTVFVTLTCMDGCREIDLLLANCTSDWMIELDVHIHEPWWEWLIYAFEADWLFNALPLPLSLSLPSNSTHSLHKRWKTTSWDLILILMWRVWDVALPTSILIALSLLCSRFIKCNEQNSSIMMIWKCEYAAVCM